MTGRNTSRDCRWGMGSHKRRCKKPGTERVERPTTVAYYCPEHFRIVERIYAGADR